MIILAKHILDIALIDSCSYIYHCTFTLWMLLYWCYFCNIRPHRGLVLLNTHNITWCLLRQPASLTLKPGTKDWVMAFCAWYHHWTTNLASHAWNVECEFSWKSTENNAFSPENGGLYLLQKWLAGSREQKFMPKVF